MRRLFGDTTGCDVAEPKDVPEAITLAVSAMTAKNIHRNRNGIFKNLRTGIWVAAADKNVGSTIFEFKNLRTGIRVAEADKNVRPTVFGTAKYFVRTGDYINSGIG